MIRIIRARRLRALREETSEAEQAAEFYSAEADMWHRHYREERELTDRLEVASRRFLAETAARVAELLAEGRRVRAERDVARVEAGMLAEVRADVERFQEAAAHPESVERPREAALALFFLREGYQRAQSEGSAEWAWACIGRALGLDEHALGLDERQGEEWGATP